MPYHVNMLSFPSVCAALVFLITQGSYAAPLVRNLAAALYLNCLVQLSQYTDSFTILLYWQVTCGSLIKLQHVNTNVNLHSHEISYGSGSGQQSVTGFSGGDDANDYWAIKAAVVSKHLQNCLPWHTCAFWTACWLPVAISTVLLQPARLQHWLLIMHVQDSECHQGTPLSSGSKIRLLHTSTQKWLHSHHFSSPLTASQEVG